MPIPPTSRALTPRSDVEPTSKSREPPEAEVSKQERQVQQDRGLAIYEEAIRKGVWRYCWELQGSGGETRERSGRWTK